jgi:hypothetical protein
MKKIAAIAIAVGAGLVVFGIVARSPGQIAISSAVIAAGVLIILFVLVLTAILFFKGRAGGTDR